MHADRISETSGALSLEGIDWELAARAGLSEDEKFVLRYFTDIESQTIYYLRDLLSTRLADDPEVQEFVTIWNYEELFHGKALAKLLDVCGAPAQTTAQVRGTASLRERAEAIATRLLAWWFGEPFSAVYLAWGAAQELTTLRGYERLEQTTSNPVLAELCRRIAKQERRHFAFYYNGARARLAGSPRAQRITRWLMTKFFTPVGSGVKPTSEVKKLFGIVFPGTDGDAIVHAIDLKLGCLPGLEHAGLLTEARRGFAV